MMARSNDFVYMAEYIKNILYFATLRQEKAVKSTGETHYFSIDQELVYENYYADFGPLNLGCVYKYCQLMNEKLKLYLNKQVIVHYTSSDPRKAANAAFLMGCYGVLYLGLSPRDALKPLTMHGALIYRPFQDATQGKSIYTITILDCLRAIKKAHSLGFFNFKDFNYEEYERLNMIAGGDLNWIVPGKFLAFIGPVDYSVSLYHPPQMYIDYFLENEVNIVIRLNKRLYDGNVFNNVGIVHYDLFFADGSCPPRHILFKFLQISEDATCAIAVHCKAGLGRTGSLIGSYLIKHYRMTAREAIGWMRICRPGSVIGHQQAWLEQLEAWLTKQGNIFRRKYFNDMEHFPVHAFGVYSVAEKTLKRKPVILEKSPTPLPPIQRSIQSNIAPPLRPQASRVREAFNKAQNEFDQSVKTGSAGSQKILYKGDQNERSRSATRRTSAGAGEPRSDSPSRASRPSTPQKSTITNNRSRNNVKPKTNESRVRNVRGSRPIPASPSPVRMTITDRNQAKGKEVNSSGLRNERVTRLGQALTVTPHKTYKVPIPRDRTPSSFSTAASQGSSRPVQRRRLGRSPSPSPPPQARVAEHTRATNTPQISSDKALEKDISKTSLKKALSRLKVVEPRDREGSIGAGSLGARRAAPAPAQARAPRVRSDERSLATQGDLLNCIKFQRRFQANNEFEKLNKKFLEKFSTTKDSEGTIRNASAVSRWSDSSNGNSTKYLLSPSREKPGASRSGLSPSRPIVQKGKNIVQNTYR